ncbi:hypothetical protein APSETT444_010693 [Aspergillus pseudonomiae]
MRIICEYNRGRSPLEWMHRYPTAPLIRFQELGIYNYLVLADEEALRDVLVKNSYDFEKPKEVRAAIAGMVGHGLVTSEGSDHRALRLAIGSGFNIHSARMFYSVIWQETRDFLARLQQDVATGSSHDAEVAGGIDVNNVFRLQPGERTVPMEVLHLSMPRTGTVSMQKALAILGIRLYHGGGTTLKRPPDTVRWMQAAKAKFNNQGPRFQRADWDQLLGDFGAVSNMPCIAFAEDLRAVYPEAKVILIQRDAASWAESFRGAFGRLHDWRTVLIAQ